MGRWTFIILLILSILTALICFNCSGVQQNNEGQSSSVQDLKAFDGTDFINGAAVTGVYLIPFSADENFI
jgi:hypothetical protein